MSRAKRWLLPGLLVGALIRLAVLPLAGTSDVIIWKTWAFGASADLTASYGIGGTPPEHREIVWQTRHMTVDYPPLTLFEMAAAGRVYRHIDPGFEDSRTLNALVKLPNLLWELVFIATLLTWGRRRFGEATAATLALAWWLNPAVILNGPVLGYLDLAMAVPAALALFAAWDGSLWLTSLLLLVAVLTKAQAVFVAPAIALLALWRMPRAWRPIAGAAVASTAVIALIVGPFILRGVGPNMAAAIARLASHDMLSANAANAWWLVTWVLRVQDMIPEWGWWRSLTQETHILAISSVMDLGYPNARPVGLTIVALAFGWGLWRARRAATLVAAAALATWCVHVYFTFAAQVHENHIALLLPFAAVAGTLDRRLRGIYWSVSAIAALNLLLFYGFGLDRLSVFRRSWTGIDATVWLAAANVAVFVWHTATVRRVWQAPAPNPIVPD